MILCRYDEGVKERNGGSFARFMANVDFHESGCWLWKGSIYQRTGYGQWYNSHKKKGGVAHKPFYEWVYGQVPEGLQLDHLCRVAHCVNPRHLEPVTPAENMRRADVALGIRSAATCCKRGHPFDERNTYHRPDGSRGCRRCRCAAARRSLLRKRASDYSLQLH